MMKKCFAILFISFSIFSVGQTATGDIETYIDNFIDNVPGSSGDNYSEPSTTQLNTWNTVIDFLLVDNLTSARSTAGGLGYQVTEFTDTSIVPNQVFYVLEKESSSSNHWGVYVFSKTPKRNNLIIQAPHIRNDINTGQQAVHCFKNTFARAVFISGTHRCNNTTSSSCDGSTSTCNAGSEPYRISDMAHNVTTMFQKTTENLLGSISNSVFVQLHGFGKRSTDPYVIMSNGTRETPTIDYATLIKDALLIEDSTLTFELAHINTSWTRLIGFTNTQGRLVNNSPNYCSASATSTTGQFIHIEQEKSKLRDDATGWAKMSNALLNVFSTTLSTDEFTLNNAIFVYPNPTLSGAFYVKGKNINFIDIYGALGQKIKTQRNFNNSPSIFINMDTMVTGVYFLNIHTSAGKVTKKIVHL